jgi:hypothetical protein
MIVFTKAFWKGALERMIKTAAQTLLTLITADQTNLVNSIPFRAYAFAVGIAVVLSLLTSILSTGASPVGSPSLVEDRPVDPGNRP